MFRITEDPSSGSLVQCLAKNYKNDSIVSVDMDVIGVMAAYCDRLCVCHIHVNGHDRTILAILAKHCIRFPDDGSSVIRNMLEHF